MIREIDLIIAFDSDALDPGDWDKTFAMADKYRSYAFENGLLALYDASRDTSLPVIYREGLGMVVDGVDPKMVKERLSKMVMLQKKGSRPAALGIMYMYSIISLQRGEGRAVLMMKLAALLGMDFLADIVDQT